VVPPSNVSLANFLGAIDQIETQLSVPWVRAYQESQISSKRRSDESRQVITLLIGHDPNTGKVKYSGSPVMMRRTIHTADSMYVFHINKVDRKSTRLNSSHVSISYAVFCLKKKII